jgi:hypothetical protein
MTASLRRRPASVSRSDPSGSRYAVGALWNATVGPPAGVELIQSRTGITLRIRAAEFPLARRM